MRAASTEFGPPWLGSSTRVGAHEHVAAERALAREALLLLLGAAASPRSSERSSGGAIIEVTTAISTTTAYDVGFSTPIERPTVATTISTAPRALRPDAEREPLARRRAPRSALPM